MSDVFEKIRNNIVFWIGLITFSLTLGGLFFKGYNYVESIKKETLLSEKGKLMIIIENIQEDQVKQAEKTDKVLERQLQLLDQYQTVNTALVIVQTNQNQLNARVDKLDYDMYDDDGKVTQKSRRLIAKRDEDIFDLKKRVLLLENK